MRATEWNGVVCADRIWQTAVDKKKISPEGWELTYGTFAHGNAETETMNGNHKKITERFATQFNLGMFVSSRRADTSLS